MVRPFALALLIASLAPVHSKAAESYDNCTGFVDSLPAVISTQGTWCLRKDVATAITGGNAIEIAANNVILDCNDFKLGGLAAGAGTNTNGVAAASRQNLTVRNCNIRGFASGIWISGPGSGHLFELNRLDGNTQHGIFLQSDNSTIRQNLVTDTGGATSFPGTTTGILTAGDGNDVLDNTVAGVLPVSDSGLAYGIHMLGAVGGTIGRNRIGGFGSSPTLPVRGIVALSDSPVIHDNVLQGVPGNTQTLAIYCQTNQGTARDNIFVGFVTGVFNCLDDGNTANPN